MATTSRTKAGLIVAVVVAVLAVLFGVITSGRDNGEGGGGGVQPPSSTASGGDRPALAEEGAQLQKALLVAGTDTPPVGSAQGMVDTYDSRRMQPAVAEIVAVEIGPSGTLLRWRIKSTGDPLSLRPSTFSSREQPSGVGSDIALVNPAVKELTKPFRYRPGQFGISCVCSSVPTKVDRTGQELSGLYPAFSQEPTQVEVRIPGFPPITGVPVTRR